MMTKFLGAFALSAVLASTAHAGSLYAAYTSPDQAPGVTVRDGTSLAQENFYLTTPASGIAANSGGFYLSNANTLAHYNSAGAVVASETFPDPTVSYTAVALGNGELYSTYDGSQQGVTVRDPSSLAQVGLFNTGVNATGITVASNGDLYLTAANNLIEYSTSGTLLNEVTYGDPALVYSGISFGNGVLAASYNSVGEGDGVTIRDLGLNQDFYFNTPFAISGITAGQSDDVYLSSGNSLYHYSDAGALLDSETFTGDPGVSYNAVSYVPTAVPEPATWLLLTGGFLGVGAMMRRRTLANTTLA